MENTNEKELRKEIKELEAQLKPKVDQLNKILKSKEEITANKTKRAKLMQFAFKKSDLVFALTSKCPCGAKLAYPKDIGIGGSWDCSDILMGKAIPNSQEGSKEHTAELPFMFYEIKADI